MRKKITSFILSVCILASSLFFSTPVQAETAKDAYMGVNDAFVLLKSVFQGLGAVTGIVDMDTLVNSYLKADEYWSSRYDETNGTVDISGSDSPIYYNSENNSYVFKPQYFNTFVNYTNDYIHRLDGYYLIEPNTDKNYFDVLFHSSDTILASSSYKSLESYKEQVYTKWQNSLIPDSHAYIIRRGLCYSSSFYINSYLADSVCYLTSNSTSGYVVSPSVGQEYMNAIRYGFNTSGGSISGIGVNHLTYSDLFSLSGNPDLNSFIIGSPFMVFYTKKLYEKYLDNGKRYAPTYIPSNDIEVPANSLTDNTISNIVGDIVINTDGLSENEIQQAIDNAVQDALNKINVSQPTPEPTETPEPIEPPIPDDSPDFTVTNAWLKKIYEYFQTFGKSHDVFVKKITDYVQKNDGKLDQIITTLEKIVSGEPSGEENGCKYDYTVLSDFLTQLWNESDKKFDNMVKLLEENNEYQQKIVTSLNEIKALLIVDTVLDFFQNRSQETANKAKEKFPTSIPWDIAMVVNAMCAEPESPVIRCPIKIESLGINEELVVDLSQDEWAKLAKTCRSMLSILFVLYMIHLTRELFFKGGDA